MPARAGRRRRASDDVNAATDAQLKQFLATFGGGAFPHAAEVLPLLSPGADATIEVTEMPNIGDLRTTYRIRAQILASRPVPPTFPKTLPADVAALAHGLEAANEQPSAAPRRRGWAVSARMRDQQLRSVRSRSAVSRGSRR